MGFGIVWTLTLFDTEESKLQKQANKWYNGITTCDVHNKQKRYHVLLASKNNRNTHAFKYSLFIPKHQHEKWYLDVPSQSHRSQNVINMWLKKKGDRQTCPTSPPFLQGAKWTCGPCHHRGDVCLWMTKRQCGKQSWFLNGPMSVLTKPSEICWMVVLAGYSAMNLFFL